MADEKTVYVQFLVRGIDPDILRRLRKHALRHKRSVQDHMRMILCHHYDLDCPPSRATPRPSKASTTFLLRVHPVLWQAVKDEATESGRSMQLIVREILESPYRKKEAA